MGSSPTGLTSFLFAARCRYDGFVPTSEWPLDDQQLAALRAALDRIVPADDWPSATELGCDEFVRRRLEASSEVLALYREGLDRLVSQGFAALPGHAQDEIIGEIEATRFGRELIENGIEGYYADPGNGGNRGAQSWKMMGFEVRG